MAASSWVGGELLAADRLANMLHKSFDFTPIWRTTTGNNSPSYGNAVIDCRYTQSGDLVIAHYDITFGSTTNFGAAPTASDDWTFSLPVDALDGAVIVQAVGELVLGTTALGARITSRARLHNKSEVKMDISNGRIDAGAIGAGNRSVADSISPFTFTSGSSVKGVIEYEAG
jgi:hypothetical protein